MTSNPIEEHLCERCRTIKNTRFYDDTTETRPGIRNIGSEREPTEGGVALPENIEDGYYCDPCVDKMSSDWWEIEKTAYMSDEEEDYV